MKNKMCAVNQLVPETSQLWCCKFNSHWSKQDWCCESTCSMKPQLDNIILTLPHCLWRCCCWFGNCCWCLSVPGDVADFRICCCTLGFSWSCCWFGNCCWSSNSWCCLGSYDAVADIWKCSLSQLPQMLQMFLCYKLLQCHLQLFLSNITLHQSTSCSSPSVNQLFLSTSQPVTPPCQLTYGCFCCQSNAPKCSKVSKMSHNAKK